MTKLSLQAQALKNAVKTLYGDAKCAEMAWQADKLYVIATLRALIEKCREVRGTGRVDKKSQVVSAKTLMKLVEELEETNAL